MNALLKDLPHLLALTLSFVLLGVGTMLVREAGVGCAESCVFGTAAESAMTGAALLVVGLFNLAAALRTR